CPLLSESLSPGVKLMRSRPSNTPSRSRLAGPKWLSLALVTLLSAQSAGVGILPRASAAAAPLAPPSGILYTVDSTGDGDNVGPVTDCNDGSGKCTLRAAIEAGNAHAGDDGIEFSLPAGSATTLTKGP